MIRFAAQVLQMQINLYLPLRFFRDKIELGEMRQ